MNGKRVLLKLSGETLAGPGGTGIHATCLDTVAAEIAGVRRIKAQLAIVIGAGNIWRGAGKTISRVTADSMGMLATIMNSLALRDVLQKRGMKAAVLSAVDVSKLADLYSPDRAVALLEQGTIVVLAGGTGNPFFTTDTTAALRAAEIEADLLLKATQVDGIYDSDPKKNPQAKRFARLSFQEAIQRQLRIMDTAAFSLCQDNHIPIVVFDFHRPGNLAKALRGGTIGTVVA